MRTVVHNTEMSGRSRAAGLADASGVSYVMVLFTIAVLGTMALSFVTVTGVETDIASNYVNNTRAHYLARAGLNVAIWGVLNIPNFTEEYGDRPTRYTFDGMPLYFMVKRAALNKSVYIGSYGNIDGAVATFEHLIISSLDLQEGPPCMVAYGEGTQAAPRYRTRQATNWSPEAVANAVDDEVMWVVLRGCPARDEKILGTLDTNGHIYAQVWDGSSWGPAGQAATDADSSCRGFDIAYETVSGDALVVYKRAFMETDVYYRVWNGTQFGAETVLDLPTGGQPRWVCMASDRHSDGIVLAALDSNDDIVVSVWNGSAFTGTTVVAPKAVTADVECMAVAYESSSGDALLVWGEKNSSRVKYVTWNGSQWSSTQDGADIGTGCRAHWMRLVPDPNSDRLLCGVLDNKNDVNVMFWDGGSWEPVLEVETGAEAISSRCFDVAFETSGNQAIVAWSDSGVHAVDYRVWTSGSWSSELAGPDVANDIRIVQLVPDPNSDAMFMTTETDDNDLQVTRWNGISWNLAEEIETDSSGGPDFESFMLAF